MNIASTAIIIGGGSSIESSDIATLSTVNMYAYLDDVAFLIISHTIAVQRRMYLSLVLSRLPLYLFTLPLLRLKL